MTRQEEIRKGLYDWFTLNRDTNDADGILRYLHSQGVVIEVDRELPNTEGCFEPGDYIAKVRMDGFDVLVVESLI